jgi:lipoprotein-anchoring transpeptidase ErfK/SrfK
VIHPPRASALASVAYRRGVTTPPTHNILTRKKTWVAVLAIAALSLTACSSSKKQAAASSTPPASSSAAATTSAPDSPTPTPTVATTPVHVSLLQGDGATYGIGIPIVAYFSKAITDSAAFLKATTVTVNGTDAGGAWYFEANGDTTKPQAAHYRTQNYWPANSAVKMNMPVQGLSAGDGLAFDDSLTLAFNIGDAHIATIDCSAETMTVTSNGAPAHAPMLTSCGAPATPTATGTKLVMQKGEDLPGTNTLRPNGAVRMVGGGGALGNYDLVVPWSVRVTQGGEYVHAAAWNGHNIGQRSTSDGCTNLNTPDAMWYFTFSQIGDVLTYSNTGGPPMKFDDGFGDWNVAWSTWKAGGQVQASN